MRRTAAGAAGGMAVVLGVGWAGLQVSPRALPPLPAYLERWGEELGDNDPARTLEVVHHLWWNAGVPRPAMHNAMKAAYYSTRRLHERGRLDRPMAYLLTAIRTALVDEQVRLGRPLPGRAASPHEDADDDRARHAV